MSENTEFAGASRSSAAVAEPPIQWSATGETFRFGTVGGVFLVRLTGEISTEMDAIRKHFDDCIRSDAPRIVVSVGDAVLTSPGLSALVETHNRASQAGGQLILCNLSAEARTTLAICKFEQIFRIVPDEAAAFAKFPPRA